MQIKSQTHTNMTERNTLAAIQAPQDPTTGISAFGHLSHQYLNKPGSFVNLVRLEPGPSSQFQFVIVLEMDDLWELVTAGTPQTLAAVQAHQDPNTRISALGHLAYQYLSNPGLCVNQVHMEPGPSN